MRHISKEFAFLCLLACNACLPLQAYAALSIDTPVKVHHVHLTGTVFQPVMEGMVDQAKKNCAMLGLSIPPLPEGEKLLKVTSDVYYGPGAMTISDVTDTNLPHPKTCQWQHKTETLIKVFTSAGVCRLSRETMRASGAACRLPIADLLRKKPPRALSTPAEKTGEIKTIAGIKCAVLELHGPIFNKRFCAAVSGPLANEFMEPPTLIHGALLQHQGWAEVSKDQLQLDLIATDVEIDISIPASTLAPQLTGQFKFDR